MSILSESTIQLNASAIDKKDAIRKAGQLLVDSGCVAPAYIDGMLAREESMSTYVGNGVSIPHGQFDDLSLIYKTGISVLQVREGIVWEDDEKAFLIIGIAASSDEHINILANLAEAIEEPESADLLAQTDDPAVILEYLNKEPEEE